MVFVIHVAAIHSIILSTRSILVIGSFFIYNSYCFKIVHLQPKHCSDSTMVKDPIIIIYILMCC